MNKYFNWEPARSRQLLDERGISFEDVVFYLQRCGLRDILGFRNPARDSQQRVLAVEIDDYVYLVPYIETDEAYFLQSITPSKKATHVYARDRK